MGLFGRRDIWLAARLSFSPLLFPITEQISYKEMEEDHKETKLERFLYNLVAAVFIGFMIWALINGTCPSSGGEQSVMEYYGIF